MFRGCLLSSVCALPQLCRTVVNVISFSHKNKTYYFLFFQIMFYLFRYWILHYSECKVTSYSARAENWRKNRWVEYMWYTYMYMYTLNRILLCWGIVIVNCERVKLLQKVIMKISEFSTTKNNYRQTASVAYQTKGRYMHDRGAEGKRLSSSSIK